MASCPAVRPTLLSVCACLALKISCLEIKQTHAILSYLDLLLYWRAQSGRSPVDIRLNYIKRTITQFRTVCLMIYFLLNQNYNRKE